MGAATNIGGATRETTICERLREENAALRQVIAELGYCTPHASLEFMQMVPAEVRAAKASKQATIDGLREALAALASAVATTEMPEAACERLLPFAMKAQAALAKARGESDQ